MKPFGSGAVTLAAAMGQAFSIQSFFIPVVKKAPNPHKYTFYTLIAYIAGATAYYYIAYVGSLCKNREIKQYGIETITILHQMIKQYKIISGRVNGR